MEELELDLIVFDEELQVRVETSQETIKEYYEAMETEEDVKKFPPPIVYFDRCRYWLADGHHRYWAAYRRGYKKMLVKVIDGSHDDAILAAVKLNGQNGLRFNGGDWEKIISLVTSKEQWSDWTNRRLAMELGCSEFTIRKYRSDESVASEIATEKRQGKDGKMYKAKKSKNPHTKTASVEPSVACEIATENHRDNDVTPSPRAEEPKAEPISPEPTPATSQVSEETLADAKAEAERILETISTLGKQITAWFDHAPEELHREFDDRLRKQIQAMIN